MQEKNVLGFKKNKTYGLCGVMLTMLFLGTCGVTAGADEVMENPSNANATKPISRSKRRVQRLFQILRLYRKEKSKPQKLLLKIRIRQ